MKRYVGLIRAVVVVVSCLSLFACEEPQAADQSMPLSVTVDEAQLHINALLVDVRTKREWQQGHIEGAVHLPVGGITAESAGVLPKNKSLVVYCAVGVRANRAAEKLRALGFAATAVREGGFAELKAASRRSP